MQIQNFVPTAGTICDFQDFCERLEAALNDPHADPKPNKMSNKEKGNKKRHRNNNNDKDDIFVFCTERTLRTRPNTAIP